MNGSGVTDRISLSSLLYVFFFLAAAVQAQQQQPDSLGSPIGANANQLVSPFAGTFSQAVPIAVPGFRGLEPRLSLVYSSEGGNGILGVGWALQGFSVIQRAKPGRGTPRYDGNDIYLLDGAELIPCGTAGLAANASCTAGGTHTTKSESYLKIKKDDPAANQWTVWGRDGTKTVFESTHTNTGGATYRWGQKTVTDTNNNSVQYTWTCVDDDPNTPGTQVQDCYPSTVSYGPYVVTLYRETAVRPDKLSYAIGDAQRLAKTNYRLHSILVAYSGSPVRAYRLSYKAGGSGVTYRSLLEQVEQFGKDVSIGGDGTITGTPPVPARVFTYRGDLAGGSFQPWPAN